MSGFQAQVGRFRAKGIQGDKASDNDVEYLSYTPLSEDSSGSLKVETGKFAWPGTDPETQVQVVGTGAPLGFVQRVQKYYNYDVTSEATMLIPEGFPVEVAKKGDFWNIADTAAVVGQKVFASNTGLISKTAAAGTLIADYSETSFVVRSAADAGDSFIMDNWGVAETVLADAETIVATSGAISLLTQYSYFDTTAGASTATLADGTEGQIKTLIMLVDGGNQVVTPANFLNGTTITFDAVADAVTLKFVGTSWVLISNSGAVVA